MALRDIIHLPSPVLSRKSKEVTDINKRVLQILDDLRETLRHVNGAGLAAPQISVLRRLAVVEGENGIIELINPEIIEHSGEIEDLEACLSVPGYHAKVVRPEKVVVKTLTREGEEVDITAEGFLARAMCHEIDHLDGIVYVDKAQPGTLKEDACEMQSQEDEWESED